jgi:HD-GYP domain-containing protein (c-di-GMP phosphodiesterase class II)
MTSDRSYQKAMEANYVATQLVGWSGTRFDPKVVNAFLACFKSGRITKNN